MIELPSVEDLRAILETSKTDAELESVINDAMLMVSPLTCVQGYEGERQAAIIKYLAADLIAGSITTSGGGALVSQRLGDAADTFATVADAKLGQTAYWAKALALDTKGCVAGLAKTKAFFERV